MTSPTGALRIAIVHEWFAVLAGSEKVVQELCALYPGADLFFVYADPRTLAETAYIRGRRVQTSFINGLPRAAKSFRAYLPLMPLAVEQFDLSGYDLVISSSHAVAKGVLTGPDQLHISYVHSPIRYAWDLQHQYLRESGMNRGLKGWLAKWILHKIRLWDYRTAAGVDCFIANSEFIARRVKKVYGREAMVIYPPVSVDDFELRRDKMDYFLTASRLAPYKRTDLIVAAFCQMPDKRLVVIGDGPEMPKIVALAQGHRNIEILGYQPFAVLKEKMQGARAFVFAAEEDFGIAPVEAQACGTPVIAFGRGGALETVRAGTQAPTGVFFGTQTVASVVAAVSRFERSADLYTPDNCRRNAERFSAQRFRRELGEFIDTRFAEFDARAFKPVVDEPQ